MLRYKQIQWQHIPFPFTRFVFIFFLAQSTFSLLSIFFLSCYLYVHLSLFLYLLVCLHCYFVLLLSFLLSVYDQNVTFLFLFSFLYLSSCLHCYFVLLFIFSFARLWSKRYVFVVLCEDEKVLPSNSTWKMNKQGRP